MEQHGAGVNRYTNSVWLFKCAGQRGGCGSHGELDYFRCINHRSHVDYEASRQLSWFYSGIIQCETMPRICSPPRIGPSELLTTITNRLYANNAINSNLHTSLSLAWLPNITSAPNSNEAPSIAYPSVYTLIYRAARH